MIDLSFLCAILKEELKKENKKMKKTETERYVKLSVRIKDKVTSLSISKSIVVLWVLFSVTTQDVDLNELAGFVKRKEYKENTIIRLVKDFIFESLGEWEKEDGKGLSSFIVEKMIHDMLYDQDLHGTYLNLVKTLDKT